MELIIAAPIHVENVISTNHLSPCATRSSITPARVDCGAHFGTDNEFSEMKTPLFDACDCVHNTASSTNILPLFPLSSFSLHPTLSSNQPLHNLNPNPQLSNHSQEQYQAHHLHHAIDQICHRRSRLCHLHCHGFAYCTSPHLTYVPSITL